MPHMFTNRPRLYDLTRVRKDLHAKFRWETINAILYKIGGLVFIFGSILFFPALDAYKDLGCWTFFFGSLLYLIVTAHDMAEVYCNWKSTKNHDIKSKLEFAAAGSYVTGTILFTVGSIFFLSSVGWTAIGAWCFVVGSLLFVVGASINVLQIIQLKSMITLQLMNLTAITFVVGAVLFTVASVPYLWHFESAVDNKILKTFLAWQYLIGSILFLMGGIFNYWRAYIVVSEARNDGFSGVKGTWSGRAATRRPAGT